MRESAATPRWARCTASRLSQATTNARRVGDSRDGAVQSAQYLAERLAFQTIDPFTKLNYERTLRKHAFPVLGPVTVTAIRREDLKVLFERLLAAKASKSLCRNILAPIKQTYEWLIDDRGLALQNPAVRLGKLLHETIDKKKRVTPLAPQDQAAFLDAARTRPRYFFLFLIALRAGLRLSECFGLKWIDFDLENRTVRIERQFREGRLIDRTKKNKVRLVDLSREVVREFRAHRNWMEQDGARPCVVAVRLHDDDGRADPREVELHAQGATAPRRACRPPAPRHLPELPTDVLHGFGPDGGRARPALRQ